MVEVNEDVLEGALGNIINLKDHLEREFICKMHEIENRPDIDIDELDDLGELPEAIFEASCKDRLFEDDTIEKAKSVQRVLSRISKKHFNADDPVGEHTANLAYDAGDVLVELAQATLSWHELRDLMKGEN